MRVKRRCCLLKRWQGVILASGRRLKETVAKTERFKQNVPERRGADSLFLLCGLILGRAGEETTRFHPVG